MYNRQDILAGVEILINFFFFCLSTIDFVWMVRINWVSVSNGTSDSLNKNFTDVPVSRNTLRLPVSVFRTKN